MNYGKILSRAWKILWEYRALWVFGIILALTAPSPGAQSGFNFGSGGSTPPTPKPVVPGTPEPEVNIDSFEEFQQELEKLDADMFVQTLEDEGIPADVIPLIIGIAIGLLVFALVLGVVMTILRYIAQVAVIRMVNDYEDTGEKMSVRQGWRAGKSRSAWQLFLIDLAVGIPVTVGFLVLLLIALLPLFLWGKGEASGIVGTVASVGLIFLLVFFTIVLVTALELLKQFFRRVCVLEHTGVRASIRQGYAMAKQNWKSIGIMWLITVGINLGWAAIIVPISILVFLVALALAGGIGVIAYGLLNLMLAGIVAQIVAGVLGILLLICILGAGLGILGNFYEIYMSTVWTLSYRDLRALGKLGPEGAPVQPWDFENTSDETGYPKELESESWKAEME